MTKEQINKIIDIDESYKLPQKLMEILMSDRKNQIFDKFMELNEDLGHDWFTEYFEEQHANKEKYSQDFTPQSLCKLIELITKEEFESCEDICAGTGGLTISVWNKNRSAFFHTEEFSSRVFPLLLLNMAIRNMNGEALLIDVLKRDNSVCYGLKPGEKYSDIYEKDIKEVTSNFDICVSNPPYSQKWEVTEEERVSRYGIAPKAKADYAFVQQALWQLKENGEGTFILPHGVLFRANKEADIRKSMIENKIIKSIIGVPDKMFLATQIPVCIIQFEKGSEGIFIINAEREFVKSKSIKEMTKEQIYKIKNSLDKRIEREGFSKKVEIKEIRENEYNLNIPRYCCHFEKEDIPDLKDTLKDIADTTREIKIAERKIISMMQQMTFESEQQKRDIMEELEKWGNK